ncbi:tRNA dihydrouridine synthase [Ottowia thiooxydans]|uniref:tRNA dihydrouridine synthase n=1 Tax=Ottowia thiooxydans TaxID=219182 RepID=UPI000414104D|nr:tRNA-dihydrouridine synthase [Ottowia thiooxydans]
MEGLLDHTLRDVLTRVGGVDRCVSEFIRITDQLLPKRVFTRVVPELLNGSRTPAGVPVRPQLLGSEPVCLAENAARLAELRPEGIDLNFGCPAKTVNLHRGGAVLLDEPELIHRIVAAVRRAVPEAIPVSAKIRLGVQDASRAIECAQAIDLAGANQLVVHARTKVQGYRPPVYWERVAEIRAAVKVSVVANGDIWSVEDALRCQEVTGCKDLMIGRGMVRDPGLGLAIQARLLGDAQGAHAVNAEPRVTWLELLPLIAEFWRQVSLRVEPRHRPGRLKQWLGSLRTRYPEAETAFDQFRQVHDCSRIDAWLAGATAHRTLKAIGVETEVAESVN